METKISSATKEVIISYDRTTVLVGERINPSGKKKLTAALQAGDLEFACKEAVAQVQAGAHVLDVNVAALGVDEVTLLPKAVKAIQAVVDVPLCVDSTNVAALEAALKVYQGKALVNSVKGEEESMNTVLPMIKHYGAVVVGLTMDEKGIPGDAERRVAIAHRIVERAEKMGIPRENIVIDCLARTLAVNQTMGAGNVSFYMPDRHFLTGTFLGIAMDAGVTCPILDVALIRPYVLAADLILGRDNHALKYIRAFREKQKTKE
jgi:5-methyltetrahydrofolate--homocysteine methyltransferase